MPAGTKKRLRAQVLSTAAPLLIWTSAAQVWSVVHASMRADPRVPPIPQAGPLAAPKSLHQVGVPVEATRAAVPADNPQTPEKIALGEKLFFDGRLSADGTVACSTCHDPAHAFTDGRATSVGIKS